jgi:hypothetical protein
MGTGNLRKAKKKEIYSFPMDEVAKPIDLEQGIGIQIRIRIVANCRIQIQIRFGLK